MSREPSKLAISSLVSVPAAVILFPLPVLAYEQWRGSLVDTLAYYTGGNPLHNAWTMVAGNPAFWASAAEPYSWWANSLRCLTAVGLVWVGFGLLYGLKRYPRQWLLLATPFCIMFAVQAGRGGLGLGVRQLYFALPLLLILSAAVVIDLTERSRLRPAGVFLVCTLLLLQPLWAAGRYLFLLGRPTTVDVGRAWILQNIPQGAILLVDSAAAPFGETEGWWEAAEIRGAEPVVVRARQARATYRIVVLKGPNAEAELADAARTEHPVFIVRTDYFSDGYWNAETVAAWGNLNAGRAPEMRRYWEDVRRRSDDLKVIRPQEIDGLGPTVRISTIRAATSPGGG